MANFKNKEAQKPEGASGSEKLIEPKKAEKQNANSTYEQWKVDVRREAKDGGGYNYLFDKVRHLKDVKIPDATAARLNENSHMSKTHYYKK